MCVFLAAGVGVSVRVAIASTVVSEFLCLCVALPESVTASLGLGHRLQVVNNSLGDRALMPGVMPVALGSTWASAPGVRVWIDDAGAAMLLRFNKGPLTSATFRDTGKSKRMFE